ncbi:hypothetical protein D3C84_1211010 [compost metagenome]
MMGALGQNHPLITVAAFLQITSDYFLALPSAINMGRVKGVAADGKVSIQVGSSFLIRVVVEIVCAFH